MHIGAKWVTIKIFVEELPARDITQLVRRPGGEMPFGSAEGPTDREYRRLAPARRALAPQPLDIEEELKESYLNYAMSVIISRALPDVRDGLKPSQRRILVAMRDLGLTPGGSTSKCAGIVGETMKRYHPHGDNSIYPTLARMAQWWNMRHLLITGQGNFGSIHGLPPAAMRYTEAKLSPVAAEMLEDIQLDTVDFQPNYDEKYQEPRVLPGKFPNLLVNGSGGIAVGMATSIPPHNLGEVCDALIAYIDDPAIDLDELMEIIPGPDFPTGGDDLRPVGHQRGVSDRPRPGHRPGQVRDRGAQGRPRPDRLHRDPLPAHQGAAAQEAGRAGQRRPDHRRVQHRRLQRPQAAGADRRHGQEGRRPQRRRQPALRVLAAPGHLQRDHAGPGRRPAQDAAAQGLARGCSSSTGST